MDFIKGNYLSLLFVATLAASGVRAQTHFAFTAATGGDMTVVVRASINPAISGVGLANGDEIGVFTPGGLCVGAAVWTGATTGITVWGDDDMTTVVDGLAAGEKLAFRVWDASNSQEYPATVAYASGGPNFGADATAILSMLTAGSGGTVTYDGNGNTGGAAPTDATLYLPADVVTVPGNTGSLVKTGYAFLGWNTAAGGGGTNFAAGQTFAMGSLNVTLYAKWTANVYTITFDKNDPAAAGSMAGQTAAYGSSATLPANGFAKAGWTFAGWAASAGGPVAWSNGASYPMGAGDVTLYAKWTANTYTITYDKNDAAAAGTMAGQTVACGSSANLAANAFTKAGWTFAGWAATAGGAVAWADGASYTMGAADVTLFAKWTQPHAVSYDGNGNTGGSAPADVTPYLPGVTVTVAGNTGGLVRTGYTFSGWNTAPGGGGTNYAANATFAMPGADVTLFAQWTPNPTYSVTYDGSGNTAGAVPTDPNNYQSGAAVTVLGNTGGLARTGFVFLGWNTAADGSGTTYAAGATFLMGPSSVALFARWAKISCLLTVSRVVGPGAPEKVEDTTVSFGDTARIAAPLLAGCLFSRWSVTGGGALILDSTQQTCGVVLRGANAEITAFYSYHVAAIPFAERIPSGFEFAGNEKNGTLAFGVPRRPGAAALRVRISKYDSRGRVLGCILDKEMRPGYYTVAAGVREKNATGMLLYGMESVGFRKTVKVIAK
jgi:uncharacterized repeat protein (TIGR02543 family)